MTGEEGKGKRVEGREAGRRGGNGMGGKKKPKSINHCSERLFTLSLTQSNFTHYRQTFFLFQRQQIVSLTTFLINLWTKSLFRSASRPGLARNLHHRLHLYHIPIQQKIGQEYEFQHDCQYLRNSTEKKTPTVCNL